MQQIRTETLSYQAQESSIVRFEMATEPHSGNIVSPTGTSFEFADLGGSTTTSSTSHCSY